MPKQCLADNCSYNVFSNGYCKNHQGKRLDEKYLAQKNKPKKVTPLKSNSKPIKKFSKKYQSEVNKYNTRVKQWKIDNPTCMFPGCEKQTEDNHHKIGRGIHLNNEEYWLPVCRLHHSWIENNSTKAKELGLSENRLSIE